MSAGPIETDAAIVGAGPVGLFAVFELGLLDIKGHVIDILEKPGGQCAELYPEKPIYDIPGLPIVTGQELTDRLLAQIKPFGAQFHLQEMVESIEKIGDPLFRVKTDAGNTFECKVVLIAAGGGSFQPKRPPIPGIEAYEAKSVHYAVRKMDAFRGKRILIVGGGDSALDWALGLQDTAKHPIALVHRRDNFRALESSVNEAKELESQGRVKILTPCEVRAVHGDGHISAVTVENTESGETEEVECDALITLLGFHSHLGAIAEWGLELEGKRQIKIDPMTCATNLPRVFAAGDVAGYPGKITLITVGMGEAAIAANNAIAQIRGEKVQPKYSTD